MKTENVIILIYQNFCAINSLVKRWFCYKWSNPSTKLKKKKTKYEKHLKYTKNTSPLFFSMKNSKKLSKFTSQN